MIVYWIGAFSLFPRWRVRWAASARQSPISAARICRYNRRRTVVFISHSAVRPSSIKVPDGRSDYRNTTGATKEMIGGAVGVIILKLADFRRMNETVESDSITIEEATCPPPSNRVYLRLAPCNARNGMEWSYRLSVADFGACRGATSCEPRT